MRVSKEIPVKFDLQLFASDPPSVDPPRDPGDGNNDFNFSGEFTEFKDPKTNKIIKFPKELNIKELVGHIISTTRTSIEDEYKPLMDSLQKENAEFKDIQIEFEKIKREKMTAQEIAEENAKKAIKEHEKNAALAKDDAAKWKGLFEKSTIRTDIFSSFGDAKLFNPGQVALLFQSEGRARISEKVDGNGKATGEFETMVTLQLEDKDGKQEEVEGTPMELFKRWIDLERNFYLRQVDINPGGGTPPARKGNTGRIDWSKLPPAERAAQAREQGVGTSK